jgi:putative transposase
VITDEELGRFRRGGFYDWLERRRNPRARAKEDEQLAQQIREVHQQSHGTYRTPRLQAELRHRGHKHGRK